MKGVRARYEVSKMSMITGVRSTDPHEATTPREKQREKKKKRRRRKQNERHSQSKHGYSTETLKKTRVLEWGGRKKALPMSRKHGKKSGFECG